MFNDGRLWITGTILTSLNPSRTTTFNAGKTVGFNFDAAANTFTVSQNLNQTTGGLTKTGSGSLLLSGSNTFTGLTQPLSGGTFSPGTSPGLLSVGTLALAGTTLMEIDGTGTRGTAYDATTVTNLLTYGGDLSLDFDALITTALADNTTLNLFDFGSSISNFTTIATVSDGSCYAELAFMDSGDGNRWTAVKGSQTLKFTHSTGDLVIIVPEPTANALAGVGLVAAAWGTRRMARHNRPLAVE